MISKEEREKKIKLLQQNLSVIRKIAGWTMQQLADEIGVTKQTVSNWEKEPPTPMNFTQYIAIRAVLDCEIKENKNEVLGEVVAILLDSEDEIDEKTYQKIKEKISTVAASAGGLTGAMLTAHYLSIVGPTLETLGTTGTALSVLGAAGTAALGPIGLIGGAAAVTSGLWLKKILKKKRS